MSGNVKRKGYNEPANLARKAQALQGCLMYMHHLRDGYVPIFNDDPWVAGYIARMEEDYADLVQQWKRAMEGHQNYTLPTHAPQNQIWKLRALRRAIANLEELQDRYRPIFDEDPIVTSLLPQLRGEHAAVIAELKTVDGFNDFVFSD